MMMREIYRNLHYPVNTEWCSCGETNDGCFIQFILNVENNIRQAQYEDIFNGAN